MLRSVLAGLALLVAVAGLRAEEASGRADLYLLAPLQNRALVALRLGFVDVPAPCPSDSGTLTMSGGVLTLHRVAARAPGRIATFEPLDDDAYVYTIAAEDCRFDLTVRLATSSGGGWRPLLLPKIHRASLSDEERGKLHADLMERLGERIRDAQASPLPNGGLALKTAFDERFAAAKLLDGAEAVNDQIEFEDPPPGCVEMLGGYAIDRLGVTFSFVANLPGELNRFLIERFDVGETVRRIGLSRHGCRLDISVTKSVRRGGLWLPVGIEPRRNEEAEAK